MAFIGMDELSGPSQVAIFLLCISNVVFVVLGIAAVVVGGYYSSRDRFVNILSSYIPGSTAADARALVDDSSHSFIVTLCIILIATGLGIAIISMIGFCGAVQRNPHCILGYVVFLMILIIAQSGALASFGAFKSKIETKVEEYFREIVAKEYKFGHGQKSGPTTMFDFIQMQFNCCGVKGASDYASAFTNWKSLYLIKGGADEKKIPYPPFCCKFIEDKKLTWKEVVELEAKDDWTYFSLESYFQPFFQVDTCLDNTSPNPQSAWTNAGCYKEFIYLVFSRVATGLLALTIAIIVFEVLCLMFSCVLLCDVNTIKSMEEMREERNHQLKTERETILAGIQATGSLGAAAMAQGPQAMQSTMFHQPNTFPGQNMNGPRGGMTGSLPAQMSMGQMPAQMSMGRIPPQMSMGGMPAQMSMRGMGRQPGTTMSMGYVGQQRQPWNIPPQRMSNIH